MICTNCFEAEYISGKTELTVNINGEKHVLRDLDCETCPVCGEITFTHGQSLEIDKKRIALEFGLKPLLTPVQLKTLRRFLGMKLDELCDLLHIGRNTYGRWERGEVEITPSMNLLVHNLIEKVPHARVNILESDRIAAIERANAILLARYISFGEYIREAITSTKLMPEVVCAAVGMEPAELVRIQNNDVAPESIPPEKTARLAYFFRINFDPLKKLLNEAANVFAMKSSVTAVHARSTCYDAKGAAVQASSVNKIMEKLAEKKSAEPGRKQVSEEYLAKVQNILERLREGGE
ncbi:MAG: type II toxin-antitoxin system MqsA family antitoxin [Desulfuromonadales bacterium]|nr:type II toxin-antitoxin system MqsA family antitoxin [Desulfuromonadales bacterium]